MKTSHSLSPQSKNPHSNKVLNSDHPWTYPLQQWVLAFRPKTLTAAVVPILAATALVGAIHPSIQWWISCLALLSSLFIQIGTNLVNDAVDFKKGADTKERIGPRRVTQAGVFSSLLVMKVGFLCFFLAVLFGIPLALRGGWPIWGIGICSVFCGYAYTGGPFPLAYRGLGDIFVILFFGIIAVTGLVYLHTLQWHMEAFVLGLQIGLHCTVLIAVNNLRDREGDFRVEKKTLPVRFGITFARYEIACLSFLPFILMLYWQKMGTLALLPFLSLPLAFSLVRKIFKTEPGPIYNQFLAQSAGLHILFGGLLSLGLALC